MNDPEGMGVYTQSTIKCIAKIHALECKANFIEKYV